MTEQNTEEFEGFDDIWSAILDERVLIKLTEKIETQRQKIKEEQQPKTRLDKGGKDDDMSRSERFSDSDDSVKKGPAEDDSPSNFKLIEKTIKSETQKSLYKQFMSESKKENQGLKFDLTKA